MKLQLVRNPKKPIMFNLSSTTDSFGNCKASPNSPCNSFPKHTHTGHHPQIKKLQKGTFPHWFLNREKIHSEVHNEVHNYLNQNKHLHTFINRRFGTAQPLKINTYVLIANKATIRNIKKDTTKKIGPYKIIDTPKLVNYKLENFSGKQITRLRSNIVTYYPKEIIQIEKNFWDNSLLRLHPKKPTITKSKSVSSLDKPDIPSDNEPFAQPPCNLSEIPESHSENYNTGDTRLRRQPMKDYRVFIQ